MVELKDGTKLSIFYYSALFSKSNGNKFVTDMSHLKDDNEVAKYQAAQQLQGPKVK